MWLLFSLMNSPEQRRSTADSCRSATANYHEVAVSAPARARALAPATGPTTGRAHAETYGHEACEACGARARCGSGGTGVPAADRRSRGRAVAVRRRQVTGAAGSLRGIGKARWPASCPGVCKVPRPRLERAPTGCRGRARRLRMRAPCCLARGRATSAGTGPSAKLLGTRGDRYACRPFRGPEARGDR